MKIRILLLFIVLSSCNLEKVKMNPLDIIDSKSIINNSYNLSNLGSISDIIPLETTDSSLIASIDKMYFIGDTICILDKQGGKCIYLYNRNGQFIRKIGKIGKGPGEYISIDDFTIDKNNFIIYLLADREKVLLYDFKGKFLRSFRTKFHPSKLEYSNVFNNLCFVNDDPGDNLIITNLNGKKIKGFLPNKDLGNHVRLLVHPFNNRDSIILYRRFLDDNVYAIKNDSLNIHYKIDFGNEALSETKLREILKLEKKEFKQNLEKFKCHIKFYIENNKIVLAYFNYNKIAYLCIYRKDIKKAETYSFFSLEDNVLFNKTFPLIENVTDKNEFVFIVEPENLIKNSMTIRNDSLKKTIKDLIIESKLRIDSNPIICILKDKNYE